MLVLDEPTVGLDIEGRAALWQVLQQLRDSGTTVLLSSHYLEEVDALADRLAILDGGRVIAEGAPESLKRDLGGDRVTCGCGNSPHPKKRSRPKACCSNLMGCARW